MTVVSNNVTNICWKRLSFPSGPKLTPEYPDELLKINFCPDDLYIFYRFRSVLGLLVGLLDLAYLYTILTGKQLFLNLFLMKCFPVSFAELLRAPILKNSSFLFFLFVCLFNLFDVSVIIYKVYNIQ